MKALATCPRVASGTPHLLTASLTFGCLSSVFSISTALMVQLGGDDHIVGAAGDGKISILIDLRQILGRLPAITTPQHQLTDDARLRRRSIRFLHLRFNPGNRLAERARLDEVIIPRPDS